MGRSATYQLFMARSCAPPAAVVPVETKVGSVQPQSWPEAQTSIPCLPLFCFAFFALLCFSTTCFGCPAIIDATDYLVASIAAKCQTAAECTVCLANGA